MYVDCDTGPQVSVPLRGIGQERPQQVNGLKRLYGFSPLAGNRSGKSSSRYEVPSRLVRFSPLAGNRSGKGGLVPSFRMASDMVLLFLSPQNGKVSVPLRGIGQESTSGVLQTAIRAVTGFSPLAGNRSGKFSYSSSGYCCLVSKFQSPCGE